jgi:hypothetical protein
MAVGDFCRPALAREEGAGAETIYEGISGARLNAGGKAIPKMTTRGRTVARATRLILIMQALQERDWTTAELAERFQVSRFTIWRDLLAIQSELREQCPIVQRRVWGMLRKLQP